MFRPVEKNFDLVACEHEILQFWKDTDAFEKLRAKNAGRPSWSFLDGPITANNPMGVHHAWGRSLKDCYQRFHAMKGRELRYQNGFDCQGLWVEVEVEKELGFKSKRDIEAYGLEKFINQCKERVNKFARIQTEQSVRLGYWMDWDREEDWGKAPGERRSYFTMSDENNYTIWAFLKKCHERKLIYKGLDAMPWCPRCGTGISEQERREGYKRILDQAVYIKLRLRARPGEHLLVWTTTPWTLAANVACAVHPEMPYAKVRQGGEIYYLARELLGALKDRGPFEVLEELPGSRLLGLEYEGPFDDLPEPAAVRGAHRVIPWKEVTATEGTGIVHVAPGCGKEDFDLSKELALPVLAPIDEAGIYSQGYGFLSGRFAGEVANEVLEELRRRNVYYKREMYEHDYPHCWRCKTQLLFRAVDEWYINMSWREEIMKLVHAIRWIPEYGKDLELDWLANMHDWMISKKRYWGLALPIFTCECGWFDVIGGKEELKARAVAGWEQFEGHSPHRPWVDAIRIRCGKCGGQAARIPDVGNPWLDAGIVPYSTVRYNRDREYWKKWIPADLVLECFPGQFRNWFYALLAMSAMMEQVPPFRTLLGHAFVRDEKGEDMSKSGPNSILFGEGAEKAGVDAMRWLFCRQNPSNNLNFGYTLTEQVRRKLFNTWWNTVSFFVSYARTDDFDPALPEVPVAERQDLDRWILSRLQELLTTANERMAEYDAPSLVREAEEFIDSLSTWYVRRSRRRFWRPKDPNDRDKLAAYQTLYEALVALCKALAPIVPFITEWFYQRLVRDVDPAAPESVHHCDYPQPDAALHDEALSREMEVAMQIVSAALALREARQLRVRLPLSEMIVLLADETQAKALRRFEAHILDELNIKKLTIAKDLGALVSHEIKANMKLLGPKYGKEAERLREGLEKLAAEQSAAWVADQVLKKNPIKLGGGEELLAEEIIVVRKETAGWAISEDRGLTVALDIRVTPELEREGLSRDIVRHIQQIRKELDLDLMDQVNVAYETADEVLRRAIEENRRYIRGETLCRDLFPGHSESAKEITLSGRDIRLMVQKIGRGKSA
jgi:isoleucyl-tRNA synthetase